MKYNIGKIVTILIISFILLVLEFFNLISIGKIINKIYPCTQNPLNSFPCFMKYDIYFMILLLTISVILCIYLLFIIAKRKLKVHNETRTHNSKY